MNEKVWKAFLKLMQEAHSMSESEVTRYLSDETLLEEKITEIKAISTENYKEGLTDGTKKAKATIIKSIKKELDIEIPDIDKVEKIGEVIKPLVAEKFKADPANPVNESDTIKNLKKAHEAEIKKITEEKDLEIANAKSEAEKTSQKVMMDSIAKSLLVEEGYAVPADKTVAEMKYELATGFIERKAYKYEQDSTDKKFYRIGEDGIRVRGKGNKPVTYEDDLREVYEVNYGKTPANNKQAIGLPNNGAGGSAPAAFDWSKLSTKVAKAPENVEEGIKLLQTPTIPLEDRKIIREYVEAEQAKAAEPAEA